MQEKQNSIFRIIVECDKDFENLPMLCRTLDQQLSNIRAENRHVCVMCWRRYGDASGLVERYAELRGYDFSPHQTLWNLDGRSAFHNCWDEMFREADAISFFWDGRDKSTANIIDMADQRRIPMRVKRYVAEENEDV